MGTSTEALKEDIRSIYRMSASEMDATTRKRLGDLRTQLLCRGYETVKGPRGGIRFKWVGYVGDDDPRWSSVDTL